MIFRKERILCFKQRKTIKMEKNQSEEGDIRLLTEINKSIGRAGGLEWNKHEVQTTSEQPYKGLEHLSEAFIQWSRGQIGSHDLRPLEGPPMPFPRYY